MHTSRTNRFRAITSSYYRGALGALLVYDVTRKPTFENVQKWLRELRDFGNPDMVVVLVGNKCDLGHSREVPEDEGRDLAEREGLCFMETSALENVNVEEAFLHMVNKIHEVMSQKSLEAKSVSETTSKSLHAAKEIINVHIDHEVTATKQTRCCSTLM